jgi:Novel STAND NTPase 1
MPRIWQKYRTQNPVVARQTAALCPYRALNPFREYDAPLFFGRNSFVINPERPEEGLLHKTRTCPLVAVVGASGSGKSSVVQAGVLPRLRCEPPSRGTWDVVLFHPGRYPFLSLATALEAVRNPDATDATRALDATKLSGSWAKGELPLDFTLNRVGDTLQVDRLLLIVDQFEELFTETPDADRRDFVTKLLAADPARVTVLLTLRADFYGRALELGLLGELMQRGIINVGAMTREERREAIEHPARLVGLDFDDGLVGLDFDDGLVERILDVVADEPGNLPLLEFALTELWERRDGRRLTHAAYDELGRVAGAIGRRADSVFDGLTPG